ncbi:Lrp/AsnC family transcriptional regulator [Gilvibacter sp.]|uniref:Lrp/AsnC family transcriptional regulator n=1 Tax=Gilvibacter sp. TaxID=2729997 RepID=UPI0035BE716F
MQLDQTDKQILNMLQEDAKITNKELSSQLNLSPTAIYERIKKLERNDFIKNYVALLNDDKIERDFVVFCQIKLLQHAKDYLTTFEADIIALPEVLECYHISGDYDYLLKVAVKDMEAYRAFMVTKLTTLQYIGSTHSSFSISAVKHTTKHEMGNE